MTSARARHILVPTEKDCQTLKSEIEGGADFAELAAKHSQCPFLTWDVEESREGSFWVRLTGSPEAKEFVRDLLNAPTNP